MRSTPLHPTRAELLGGLAGAFAAGLTGAARAAPTLAPAQVLRPGAVSGGSSRRSAIGDGYYRTLWPSEHADAWRSHAAPSGGLPRDFAARGLTVSATDLVLPTWGYTRNRDEVFVIGGSPQLLDVFTQAIVRSGPPAPADLVRSLRADQAPMTAYVAKLDPLTLAKRITPLTGGSTVNYTGGLVMHRNGSVYAVAQSVLYRIDPRTMDVVARLALPHLGDAAEAYWTTYNGLQVLPNGELVLKGFHLRRSAETPGWLLLVDPETLSVDVRQPAFVSSARLTLGLGPRGEVLLYHVNATESLRFRVTDDGFALDEAWTRPYRQLGDGSTQASSPLLFGPVGQVAFADNTAPGARTPIRLFVHPARGQAGGKPLVGQTAFSAARPSFNFFMVAGDPYGSQTLVYYDPLNSAVTAFQLGSDGQLTRRWEREGYKVSASPAIVADRSHLYLDDYRDGVDHFVALDLRTGRELARLPLPATLPTVGTIFPGLNDDVYVLSSEAGAPTGKFSRIHLR